MKKQINLTLILAFVVILLFPAKAAASQGERRNILGEGTDYTAILYDSTNGLPTSEANAIVQSSDGFIWLGGYSGLIRYDGTSFYRFDSSTGISSVFSLYVDSKDRIYIGTNENGIACYDHGNLRIYGRVESLKSASIRAINEDRDNNIIIATTQGLAYIGEDLEIHPIDAPQLNSEYITHLEKSGRGTILGLTLNGSVFEMDNLSVTSFYNPDQFGEDLINSIYQDPDNPSVVYMGTESEEILMVDVEKDMKILERLSTTPQKNINSIKMINNLLWVSATNGVGYFDEENNYNELSGIPMNNSVGHIMTDHEGNIWLTSTRQGILKLVPDRFSDISRLAGLESMVVNSTCVNGDLIYIATDSGLKIIENTSYEPVENELTKMLEGIRIRCIKNDSKDRLWLCTHGDLGLICYDPKSKDIKLYNEENGLSAARVRAVTELSDGSMAAATGNGLYIVKDGKISAHYGQDEGISTTEILSVEEGKDGRLYLGSDGDGIYVVEKNKISRLGIENGLTSGVVMRIKKDEERGLFWLITSNSIEYMNEEDQTIKAVSNFPYSNNYDIYFDDHGGAWILSSNGIYITKVSELLKNEAIEYSFYNTKSGLPYISTGNSRSHITEDGVLYISGTTGICAVDINAEDSSNCDVKLSIPSIEIDDEIINITPDETIEIPSGIKRLTIDAYAITFGLSNPRISYYLEGFDKAPILTTKQELTPIKYTNLDGGKYKFHISVLDDETGEAKNTISLAFSKKRSIFEIQILWIAIILITSAAVVSLMWNYFQKRNKALLIKQSEDKRLIDQIIYAFAKCIDMRDVQNKGHSFRVAWYTRLISEKLKKKRGYTNEQIDEFYNVALLHDIGKLSIPDRILNKPERLNDEEYIIMKTHAAKGEEILKDVNIVKDLAIGAGSHHERMDGRGYPRGLSGQEIPEVARIIAVADTFDAMYSTRPYRKKLELSVVLEEIKRIKGTQLEAEVVDALLELADENMLDTSPLGLIS